jgi:hypothetical protein
MGSASSRAANEGNTESLLRDVDALRSVIQDQDKESAQRIAAFKARVEELEKQSEILMASLQEQNKLRVSTRQSTNEDRFQRIIEILPGNRYGLVFQKDIQVCS